MYRIYFYTQPQGIDNYVKLCGCAAVLAAPGIAAVGLLGLKYQSNACY